MASERDDPLSSDLLVMLDAVRLAERRLFSRLDDREMEEPMPGDAWSPRDLLGHLAAWRAIEARRLNAASGLAPVPDDDPLPDEDVDNANDRLQRARAAGSRPDAEAEAEASLDALAEAIGHASTESLCECDQLAAGIGANGINHAVGHLGDLARLVEDQPTYDELSDTVERVLARGHLLPRDSGVLLYNLACHDALTGDHDAARRRLRTAFARRPDLAEHAQDDPDLASIKAELADLARGPSAQGGDSA